MPDKLPPFLTKDAAGVVKITGTPYLLADFKAHAGEPDGELSDRFPALALASLNELREWVKANTTAAE